MGRTFCSPRALFLLTKKVQPDLKYMSWAVSMSFANYRTECIKSFVYICFILDLVN